jgi:hypothetical protein
VVSWADAALWGCTIAACTTADTSVMYECALETREPSCVSSAANPFFIPMVHSPPGTVGDMAAPKLPSQEGIAPSRGTHDNTGALLSKMQSPEPWDTWQRRSSPQHGGEVWGRGIRGSAGAHLSKEARFGAKGHVVAQELTSARRRGPGPRDTWRLQNPPLQGGVVRSYSLRGSAWKHVLLLVLT